MKRHRLLKLLAVVAMALMFLFAGCAQLEPVAGRSADNAKGLFGSLFRNSNKSASQNDAPQPPPEPTYRNQPSARPKPTPSPRTTKNSEKPKKEEPSLGGAERPGGL